MNNKKLPIGFYLKKVDNLLTEGINNIHSAFGLTRTHWQILNSIYENPNIDKQSLFEMMVQFADINSLEGILADLISKQNIIQNKERFTLTEIGQSLYVNCLEKQYDFRKKAMTGITETEYSQLLSTLDKLISNLS